MKSVFANGRSSDAGSSSTAHDLPTEREEQLAAVIEEYLATLETGCSCSPEELISAHPEIARELRTCLEGLHAVESAAGSLGRSDSRMAELTRAKHLGDFEIVRELGRGGMGIVYEAVQVSLGRRVALKVLPFAGLFDRSRIARFQAEAKAAARLHHPHIVPVHSVGRERGVQYYSMQYIEGRGLDGLIQELREPPHERNGQTSTPSPFGRGSPGATAGNREYYCAIARLGMQAADALAHAHECGIAHRDVKPSNLLLDEQGEIWLTDFGLAQLDAQGSLTLSGDLLGTLRYMSPEQALGTPSLDGTRMDIYSLGATLYELVALAPAFQGRDRQAILRAISVDEPVSLSRIRPDTPRELETIIAKAMEKDPARRYDTAAELANDLQRFVENRPIHAIRPTALDRALKWSRRHHAAVAAAGIVLLLFVIGLSIGTFLVKTAYDQADARRDDLEHHLYVAHMRLAGEAYESANTARVETLLRRHVPVPGDADPRGWEWYYLNALSHSELARIHAGKEPVLVTAWSPDGRWIAFGDAAGTLRVWSVQDREQPVEKIYAGSVTPALAFSPDSQLLAMGCGDGVARVFKLPHGDEVFAVATGSPGARAAAVAFSPDGQRLAVGGNRRAVEIFKTDDWHSSAKLLFLNSDASEKHQVLSLSFSPDGRQLAAGLFWPREVVVWELGSGQSTRFEAHHWIVRSVAWSPDGKILASSGHDQKIRLWRPKVWEEMGASLDHRGIAYALAWAPLATGIASGKHRLAAAGGDGTVRVHVIEEERVASTVTLRGHAGKVWSVAWSPDARTIVTAGQDGTVRLWDPARNRHRRSLAGEYPATWSTRGKFLAMEGQGGLVHVLGADSLEILRTLPTGEEDRPQALAFRSTDQLLAVATDRGELILWPWKANQPARILEGPRSGICCVAWSPDGSILASGDKLGRCTVWNLETDQPGRILDAHEGWLGALAFSPNGRYLATTGDDQRLIVRAIGTWRELAVFQRDLSAHARDETRQDALAWSPDSTRIAAGSASGELVVWEVLSGTELHRLDGHSASVLSVAWSPNGTRIASGAEDRDLKIWDSESGDELLTIRGFDWRVGALAWHPDGTRLLAGHGFPNSLRVLDARAGYEGEPETTTSAAR